MKSKIILWTIVIVCLYVSASKIYHTFADEISLQEMIRHETKPSN